MLGKRILLAGLLAALVQPGLALAQNQASAAGIVLTGDWRCGEGVCKIVQKGDALTFFNTYGDSSSGRFTRPNAVVADTWDGIQGSLGAYYNGNRMAATEARDRFGIGVSEILWGNGMVWTRVGEPQSGARVQYQASAPAIALTGDWRCGEGVCRIVQNGEALTFFNTYGDSSSGRFTRPNAVVADAWDGIQGSLGAYYNGNRMAATEARDRFGISVSEILWGNGMVWTWLGESQPGTTIPPAQAGATPVSSAPATPGGDYFEGDIFNARGGKGIWVGPNGDRYHGDFVSGKPNGNGLFNFAGGEQYQGQVSDGLPNGRGTYVWPNGNRYDGDFQYGKMTGQGEIRLANGDHYVGGFVDGVFTGRGSLMFADGSKYDGDFVNGVYQGSGTYSSGGSVYQGEFVNGQFHGSGSLTHANGERFVGTFAYGKYLSK